MELMNELTHGLAKQILDKKNEVIKNKLTQMGLIHLLDGIDKQRFKRIAVEYHEGLEKYFADNGTNEGLLIITFKEIKSDFSDGKINCELSYY